MPSSEPSPHLGPCARAGTARAQALARRGERQGTITEISADRGDSVPAASTALTAKKCVVPEFTGPNTAWGTLTLMVVAS